MFAITMSRLYHPKGGTIGALSAVIFTAYITRFENNFISATRAGGRRSESERLLGNIIFVVISVLFFAFSLTV